MRLPANWRSAVVSLLVSGSALGAAWHSMRHQRAGRESGGGGPHPSQAQAEAEDHPSVTPSVKALTDQEADAVLQKMRHLLGTLTYNGVPQPEELPVDMVFPVLEGLPPADLVFLLRRAESEKDEVMRNGLRRVLFTACSVAAPEEALKAASGWPPEFADKLLPPLLAAWRLQNGDAPAWFRQMESKNPGLWKESRNRVSPDMPTVPDPPAPPPPATLAAAWEETCRRNDKLNATTWTSEALTPVVAWAAESDQWEQAFRQLDSLPDPKLGFARKGLLSAWAGKDWRGWLEWERAHPERISAEADRDWPYAFESILWEVIFQFSNRLHMEEEVDSEELAIFMDEYVNLMAGRTNSGNTLRFGMQLLDNWVKADPGQASAWLDRQKPGTLRDKGVETLAKAMIGEDPVPAVAWAASIADPALREAALVECWKTWRGLEPAPADAWIDDHFPEVRASAARLAEEKK